MVVFGLSWVSLRASWCSLGALLRDFGSYENNCKTVENASRCNESNISEKQRKVKKTIKTLENDSRSSESNIVATSKASETVAKRSRTLPVVARATFRKASKMIKCCGNDRKRLPRQRELHVQAFGSFQSNILGSLGASWGSLGASWCSLGVLLGLSWGLLGSLGGSWSSLWVLWSGLGALFGHILGRSRRPESFFFEVF